MPHLSRLSFICLVPMVLSAQVHLSGRVARIVDGDTLPAVGSRAVLHRVTQSIQGPVDSSMVTANGRFNFRVRPDSGEVYLVSARWGGVEYFGAPFNAPMLATDQETLVIVSDTSSKVPLVLVGRQLVIAAPAPDGTREVVDVYTFVNPGNLTKVITSEQPWSWRAQLPAGVLEAHIEESDFSNDAFEVRGDSVLLVGAIPPGKHAVIVGYHLASGVRHVDIQSLERAESLTVMSEESGLSIGNLLRGETRELDGKSFTEWSGTADAGEMTALKFPSDGRAPEWALPVLIGVLGLGLLGAGVMVAKGKRLLQSGVPARSAAPEIDQLLGRIAAIDREMAAIGKAGGESGEYLQERALLKAELGRALASAKNAGGPPHSR